MSQHHDIDGMFKKAFADWEAPVAPGQMSADWQAVGQHAQQAGQAAQTGGQVGSAAGKMAGILGSGAAKLVLTALIGGGLAFGGYQLANQEQEAAKAETTALSLAAPEENEKAAPETASIVGAQAADEAASPQQSIASAPRAAAPVRRRRTAPQQQAANNQHTTSLASIGYGKPEIPKPEKPEPATVIFSLEKTSVCVGAEAMVRTNGVKGVKVDWGDGTVNEQVFHRYQKPGTYNIVAIEGERLALNASIAVQQPQEAGIESQSQNGLNVEMAAREGFADYVWLTGDGNVQPGRQLRHTYRASGNYRVALVTRSREGCIDTVIAPVSVKENVAIVVPNFITPNGDGINDKLEISAPDAEVFELRILDDKGRTVFAADSPSEQWDGTCPDGTPCPDRQHYIYVLKVRVSGEAEARTLGGRIFLER